MRTMLIIGVSVLGLQCSCESEQAKKVSQDSSGVQNFDPAKGPKRDKDEVPDFITNRLPKIPVREPIADLSAIPKDSLKEGWTLESMQEAQKRCTDAFVLRTKTDYARKSKASMDRVDSLAQALTPSSKQLCSCVVRQAATTQPIEKIDPATLADFEMLMKTVIEEFKTGKCRVGGPIGQMMQKMTRQ